VPSVARRRLSHRWPALNAPHTADITVLSCPVEEAVRIASRLLAGRNLEVFSPTIGKQLLRLALIDEIDLHLGAGAAG
jgi:hypothetical protein